MLNGYLLSIKVWYILKKNTFCTKGFRRRIHSLKWKKQTSNRVNEISNSLTLRHLQTSIELVTGLCRCHEHPTSDQKYTFNHTLCVCFQRILRSSGCLLWVEFDIRYVSWWLLLCFYNHCFYLFITYFYSSKRCLLHWMNLMDVILNKRVQESLL